MGSVIPTLFFSAGAFLSCELPSGTLPKSFINGLYIIYLPGKRRGKLIRNSLRSCCCSASGTFTRKSPMVPAVFTCFESASRFSGKPSPALLIVASKIC
jgi:hypothetical protein